MIVLIEGPDNTGKTTLARELERRGFQYEHHSVPPPGVDLFALYARTLADAALRGSVVIDRLHPAEWAYGNVMRGHSRVSPSQLVLLNNMVFELGCMVLCSAPSNEIIELWRARKDREYVQDEEKIKAIIEQYDTLERVAAISYSKKVLYYDFTQNFGRAGDFADQIIRSGGTAE